MMKRRTVGIVLTMMVVAGLAISGPAAQQAADRYSTPAEAAIARAKQAVVKSPDAARGYSDLAMALARRARETSDPVFYLQAEDAISKSLERSPDNFDALKARAWVWLGQHRFREARDLAATLNKRVPDDVMVYGLLTDAHVELGEYAEAEKACQWMLDLRPGNIPGLTRAAYLRELFGDVEGALELMHMAVEQNPIDEVEDRAWILTQIGHLHTAVGRLDAAEAVLAEALQTFPGYHYTLAALAKVRTAQHKPAEAAALLRQRYEAAPHPENLFDLAESLALAGRKAEADAAFLQFEQAARQEMNGADNANRELIFYYVDHARKPVEALRVADREIEQRRDVYTLDAYAWALHANGRHAEAQKQLDLALSVGIRDPKLSKHASAIAEALGGGAVARR